tara:strand:- start:129 stop:404 length:276 start_codon:yes stop_codon:yes gene_type:complete
MQLYALYMATATHCYSECNTNIILSLDKLDQVLLDEEFIANYQYYIEQGITGSKVGLPDSRGRIEVTLQYLDCLGDFDETVATLVPVRSFL